MSRLRWPNSRHSLSDVSGTVQIANSQIALLLPETGDYQVLGRGYGARYSPTGHVVFGRDDALWAVGFDLQALAFVGEPVRVLEQIAVAGTGAVNFAFSANGSLAYLGGGTPSRTMLEWIDRDGGTLGEVTEGRSPHLSPDERRLLFQRGPGAPGFWVRDLESSGEIRLASEGGGAQWAADGQYVSFWRSTPDGNQAFRMRPDQTDEAAVLVAVPGHNVIDVAWVQGGERFLFRLLSRIGG